MEKENPTVLDYLNCSINGIALSAGELQENQIAIKCKDSGHVCKAKSCFTIAPEADLSI